MTTVLRAPRDTERLYSERLTRYVTAMRKGIPDRAPVRPLAAEITAKYAGFTCQEVTHDYSKAFEAGSAAPGTSNGTRWRRTWCMCGRD